MGWLDFIKSLFDAPDKSDPVSDRKVLLAEVQRAAASIDAIMDDLKAPNQLLENPFFLHALKILSDPVFTNHELLKLSDDPTDAIWQMGVVAAGKRDSDTSLVDPLLKMFDDSWAWQQHFIMHALLPHTPIERSLAGEILFRYRKMMGPHLEHILRTTAPVLKLRREAGEKPSFGQLLDKLDGSGAEDLEDMLKTALESSVADDARILWGEYQIWQSSYVDRSVLSNIGRIHGEGRLRPPLILSHPLLDTAVNEVLRSIRQEPPRSVLITGEQGVGKTAVFHKVAEELAGQGWLIFEASGSDLIAGQSYIGEFEARIRDLVAQIGGGRRVLWYIPDFQSLAWVGKTIQSKSGAIDLIYPHLESGQIVVVGELTSSAFQQLVQDVPRLQTACEVCVIPPLEESDALNLATNWAAALQVEGEPEFLPPAVLAEAWLLARQYLRDRESPGCLIDFLDQTRKIMAAESTETVGLTRDALITTLSAMTGLPHHILDEREVLDPARLQAFFDERILGQAEAVTCLLERISLIKAGLTDPSRPQGVFLFAGPTGTGKTEIAKALATFLFGSEDRLLRCDMSEFQTPDSLERLVGDGQNLDRESLTVKVRKQPFSIVLLDEFEKAHPKVWDLFLQVFDDGRLTDPMGRTSDFRHTIIILTSNLGGQAATGAGLGFDQDGQGFRATEVGRAVTKAFRPEFLNRLDRVVVFNPFTREVMRELLEKELRDIQDRRGLRNRSWAVVWEDSALEFLLDKGFSPTLGARPLKRAVERFLLTPLAAIIVKGDFPAGDQFLYIQTRDGGLAVDFIDPDAPDESESAAASGPDKGACAEAQAGERCCLAAIAMNAAGTPREIGTLWDVWNELHDRLESADWKDAKDLALSMTSVPDFWSSPERFTVLGEVEYRERVETGLETVGSLLQRIDPESGSPRERYPRRMVGQAADRLRLLEEACRSIEDRRVWESFVLIEDKRAITDRAASPLDWVRKLADMYLGWSRARKMRVQILEDVPQKTGRSRSLLMAVSGYAAHAILEPEEGLHVWEQPDPSRPNATIQMKALVRVVAQPDDRVAESDRELLKLGKEATATPAQGVPAVVRSYRENPDPLVKDRVRGWRSGRLDRVMAGDFDLLGACSTPRDAERS